MYVLYVCMCVHHQYLCMHACTYVWYYMNLLCHSVYESTVYNIVCMSMNAQCLCMYVCTISYSVYECIYLIYVCVQHQYVDEPSLPQMPTPTTLSWIMPTSLAPSPNCIYVSINVCMYVCMYVLRKYYS